MIKNKKILITGASGFIGKHLISKLLKNSNTIACIDLHFDSTFIELFSKDTILYKGCLTDKDFITSCINEFDPTYVFHLAGSKNRINSFSEFTLNHNINYLGTLNLYESLVKKNGLKLLISMGTIEEYGYSKSPFKEDSYELPNSAYGLSKLSATKLALIFNKQFNLPIVVMRPSIIYGPGQGEEMFVPALISSLLKGIPFKMTKGNQLRDFVYIDDLIDALILCLNIKKIGGQIINIASGVSIKLKQIAWQIAEITNDSGNLFIGELDYRKSEIMSYKVDISKAFILLKWTPRTKLINGLEKTVSYYKGNIK